jgi:uncharacterized protein YlxW (UPF0749 family)
MKNINNKIMIILLFAFLGVSITIQIRSNFLNRTSASTDVYRYAQMEQQLKIEQDYGIKLKSMIDSNEKEKLKYLEVKTSNTEYDIKLREFERLNLVNGLTDVNGDGIYIKLNDALKAGDDQLSEYLIHDYRINALINDLRNAGAQAISINNERIIVNSELICAGPTLKINKNRYAVPYEVKAIGDPQKMKIEIEKSANILEMQSKNIRIEIVMEKNMTIPKYRNKTDDLISGLEVKNSEIK